MIRPTALYNAARFTRDVNSIGRVLAVLCGNPRVRREDLTDAELTTLEIVENENEEMEKNLAKERERKALYRRKKPTKSETCENDEEMPENEELENGTFCPETIRPECPTDKTDGTARPECPTDKTDGTKKAVCPHQSINQSIKQSINQSIKQSNKQTEPNPSRPERACAGARVRVREGGAADDDIPPPHPELIPPSVSGAGSGSASGRFKSLVSDSVLQSVTAPPPRKKRLDVYALDDSAFFSPEYAALDLFVAACGAGFWAKAIRALGDAECREELNAFIHEVRAGESVKNPAAVMTKRLQALAHRKNIPL